MTPEEIVTTLRGIVAYCDETHKKAGLAGVFPGPELRALSQIGDEVEAILRALVPAEPERPEIPSTWGQVCAGDSVQAPDGSWYVVDSWARNGEMTKTLLRVGDGLVANVQPAAGTVTVRRGPEGQAVDVLRSAFPDLERIG